MSETVAALESVIIQTCGPDMDDDFEDEEIAEDYLTKREKELGFRPVREVIHNKLLPYSDLLDEESERWYREIKTNLAMAVAMKEIKPGLVTWISRLSKYIKHFGYKFPKEDHLAMIRMFFDIVTSPDLDPWLVTKIGNALNTLLTPKNLITQEELELPWRPLYDLFEKYMYSPYEPLGMIQFAPSLESCLRRLIRGCRCYFDISATQEMLDEWRPLMCPYDVTMGKAMSYFELFLPTLNIHQHKEQTYELWFDEFMHFWKACHNHPNWEAPLVHLFTRLAHHNIGLIDWEPYVPMFFSKIQKDLNLPVFYKKTNAGGRMPSGDPVTVSRLIVSCFGHKNSVQKHLHQLFQVLESYYHPANIGVHTQKLIDFLSKLISAFIERLRRERYSKEKWGYVISPEHKLTEQDITSFVETVKPAAMLSMYNKFGMVDSVHILQQLANLRPELILPSLIERMQDALGTLTEPHKLIASMNGVLSTARTMVHPGPQYPIAKTTVIPFMLEVLPGIDPNDMRKSFITFQFISTFCTIIPIVDSSSAFQYHSDLTEEEREICGQTAQFEDLIIQFLDRCFNLIESSSLEHIREETSSSDHRNSREENMKDIGMASTFSSMLLQSSPQLYEIALKKVHRFIDGRIMEAKISGKIAAGLCRSLCKARPDRALKIFLENAMENILSLVKEPILKEQNLSDDILFNLLLISECVRVPGQYLLPFMPKLKQVLDKTLHLVSKEGYTLSSTILGNILKALTYLAPMEFKAIADGYDRPVQEYLPIKDWGKPGNIHNAKITWHISSDDEIENAQSLLDKYLGDEMDCLIKFANGEEKLTKEEVLTRLTIIGKIMHGCGSVLPFWDDSDSSFVKIVDSEVHTPPFALKTLPSERKLNLRGKNVRLEILNALDKVQNCLLEEKEDDTNSFNCLLSIYHAALLFGGIWREEYDQRFKSYNLARRSLDNKLQGSRRRIRALIIDRALLQHEQRMLERSHIQLTEAHVKIFHNLLTLATSQYSNVRARAQDVLHRCLNSFSYSYKLVVPRLVSFLKKSDDVSHEQFKGALYVLLGPKHRTMLTKHSWDAVNQLWPALVQAQHSEKPSISKLLDCIFQAVFRSIDTFGITLNLPTSAVEKAKQVLASSPNLKAVKSLRDFPNDEELKGGRKLLEKFNSKNVELYNELSEKLCSLIESGNLFWRNYNMALGMLGLLTRHDQLVSARVTKIFVQNLNHDDLSVRKSALHLVGCVLKQQKRLHKKIEIKPVKNPSELPSHPGDRPDNLWMCFDPEKVPKSAAEWDEPRYVHKTHYGYYTWPKKMLVYAPTAQQPKLDRAFNELNDVEKEMYNFFSSEEQVKKLIKFLSLEERKGRDKFDPRRFCMFKGLFRNYGDTFLPLFRPHLEALIEDGTESSQRCVAEIVAALIRGSKHWSYEKTEAMYNWLVPLIRTVLSKISVETIGDWGTCFATASESRDPFKIHWMLSVLLEEPLRSQGSFMDSSRLYVLQGALAQQEWRAGPLLYQLLNFLQPFCSHPYQNVRERIGSVLTNIFLNDIEFVSKKEGQKSNQRSPKVTDFIRSIIPDLEILKQEDESNGASANESSSTSEDEMGGRPKEGGDLAKRSEPMKQMPPGARFPLPSEGIFAPGIQLPPGVRPHMIQPGMNVPMEMPPQGGFMAMMPQNMPSGSRMPYPPPPFPRPHMTPEDLEKLKGSMPPEMFQMLKEQSQLPQSSSAKARLSPEKEKAIRLLETICRFLTGSVVRSFYSMKSEVFQLLDILCVNESNEIEPNLARECTIALACISQGLILKETFPKCLEAMERVCKSNSWRARAAVLEFMQVFLFNNIHVIVSEKDWVNRIMALIRGALADERVEVREKAGFILGGLLHCDIMDVNETKELLASFRKEARKKLKKRKADESAPRGDDEFAIKIRKRHSAIIGLCAFVNAYPYDVPEFVPEVLVILSEHLHDPLPIPLTIKKTLQDFKRTHQDNWQEHRKKFSDDQLSVITDLLVSPSYYA